MSLPSDADALRDRVAALAARVEELETEAEADRALYLRIGMGHTDPELKAKPESEVFGALEQQNRDALYELRRPSREVPALLRVEERRRRSRARCRFARDAHDRPEAPGASSARARTRRPRRRRRRRPRRRRRRRPRLRLRRRPRLRRRRRRRRRLSRPLRARSASRYARTPSRARAKFATRWTCSRRTRAATRPPRCPAPRSTSV